MRIFFSGRAIIIDGFRAPLEPDTLTATITNGIVSIVNAGNGMALVSSVWAAITDANGNSFASSDALMSYLAATFTTLPPPALSKLRIVTLDPAGIGPEDNATLVGIRKTLPSPTLVPLFDAYWGSSIGWKAS